MKILINKVLSVHPANLFILLQKSLRKTKSLNTNNQKWKKSQYKQSKMQKRTGTND